MRFKIKEFYLDEILKGNKTWELRTYKSYEGKLSPDNVHFELVSDKKERKLRIKIKMFSVMNFKDIPVDVLADIFCLKRKATHFVNTTIPESELQWRKDDAKVLFIKENALREMKMFYPNFTEDTECVLMKVN